MDKRAVAIAVLSGAALLGGTVGVLAFREGDGIRSSAPAVQRYADTTTSSQNPTSTQPVDSSIAVIGPDGGSVELAGQAQLDVAAGALSANVEVSIVSGASSVAELSDADVYAALAEWVTTHHSDAHPVFAPVLAIAGAEPLGASVELQPAGTVFAVPATLTVPYPESLVDSEVVAVLEDGSGWELVDVETVPGGAVMVEIPHFSKVSLWSIAKNVWNNGLTLDADDESFARALETLDLGPIDRIEDELTSVACRADITFDSAALPTLVDVGWYTGFESQRIGTYSPASYDAVHGAVKSRFDPETRGPLDGAPMSVEQLIQLALDETEGDLFQALVLAHDVLRDHRDNISVQNVVEPIRGDGGDENGARYHLLGPAVYAFAEAWTRDNGGQPWYHPSTEYVLAVEEAWISGDINTDTVEYAIDLRGAQLGRALYDMYQAAAGRGDTQQQQYYRLWCDHEPPTEPVADPTATRGDGDWVIYRLRERSETTAGACASDDDDQIEVAIRHLESWHVATREHLERELESIHTAEPTLNQWYFSACSYHRRTDWEAIVLVDGANETWATQRYEQLASQLRAAGWQEEYSSWFPNYYSAARPDHATTATMTVGDIRAATAE